MKRTSCNVKLNYHGPMQEPLTTCSRKLHLVMHTLMPIFENPLKKPMVSQPRTVNLLQTLDMV